MATAKEHKASGDAYELLDGIKSVLNNTSVTTNPYTQDERSEAKLHSWCAVAHHSYSKNIGMAKEQKTKAKQVQVKTKSTTATPHPIHQLPFIRSETIVMSANESQAKCSTSLLTASQYWPVKPKYSISKCHLMWFDTSIYSISECHWCHPIILTA